MKIAAGVLVAVSCLAGCETAYYGAMEQFGIHKREIMVDRVEEAMDAQEAAKEQFSSALEAFASVVDIDAGNLERVYEDLNRAFERSEDRAQEVTERIDAVEDVSEALFTEWETELGEYTDQSLKRRSEEQLASTQERYRTLMQSMRRAEASIDPVLNTFRDQVLFLKHNLNAQAVASLRTELDEIETDVARLIAEMEESIERSRAFIEDMRAG